MMSLFGNRSNVAILTVHYNTPSLLKDLLESIQKFYPKIKTYVVDGSDKKEYRKEVRSIIKGKRVKLFQLCKNIHHGPGIDYGMRRIKRKYVLLLDTDSLIIKEGLVERMENLLKYNYESYGVGTIQYVNNDGWDVTENGIPYLHPRCAMLNREMYFKYPPAIKHGAPMINTMIEFNRRGSSWKIIGFEDMNQYYYHIGRGTVNATGGWHI